MIQLSLFTIRLSKECRAILLIALKVVNLLFTNSCLILHIFHTSNILRKQLFKVSNYRDVIGRFDGLRLPKRQEQGMDVLKILGNRTGLLF